MDHRTLHLLRMAWLVVLWLRLWPLLVPPLALAAVVASLALLSLPARLPDGMWFTTLLTAALAEAILLGRLVWRLRPPTVRDAARYVERECGAVHRPLSTLLDGPVSQDPQTLALWDEHVRRLLARTPLWLPLWPASPIAVADPYGLRVGAWLLLIIAITVAGPQSIPRLQQAVMVANPLTPQQVDVWVTPPAYTGLPPKVLGQSAQPTPIPVGSSILVLLRGGWGTPILSLGAARHVLQDQGDGLAFRTVATYEGGDRLTVRRWGIAVADWPLRPLADHPPAISLDQAEPMGPMGRMALHMTAQDDYGVQAVGVDVQPLNDDDPPLRQPLALSVPRSGRINGSLDLASHPWAGQAVTLTPWAIDGAGQHSSGAPVLTVLPLRQFKSPLAQAMDINRRILLSDRAAAPFVHDVVAEVSADPQVTQSTALSLMTALTQAVLRRPDFHLSEAASLMWGTALRLEDGDLAAARQAVDDARAALQQAMNDRRDLEQIRRHLQDLADALRHMLGLLAEQQGATGQGQGRDWLRGMEDLAQMGALDALQSGLQSLDQWLDTIQSRLRADGRLTQVIQQQQDALDALRADPRRADHRSRQGRVNRALADILADLSQVPDPMADAAQAMAQALNALVQQQTDSAIQSQTQALRLLRQAQSQTAPLTVPGRSMGSAGGDDGATRIPSGAEMGYVRQILDELRRRAADGQRTPDERDYLLRLLRRF